MKKQVFTISFLLFICFNVLYAQDTITTYYTHKWKTCDKVSAVYYRKVFPDSFGMWKVNDYYMNGQLQMGGRYSDKKLKRQQGSVIYYHFNGAVAETGQYKNNKKIGVWKRYYKDGNISSIGTMKNDKQDGIWTFNNLNCKNPFGQIFFKNGKAEGESKWCYESGKICEIINYRKDKIITKTNYDEDGNIVIVNEKDCNVEFVGGNANMYQFLQQNVNYPEGLRLQSKEGIVLIGFIIRKDGKIDNIVIEKSDDPLFNEEAIRVANLIKSMKPARKHGQIIEQECILPITFKLTN